MKRRPKVSSTHQNVVALNRYFLRAIKKRVLTDSHNEGVIFWIDPRFSQNIAEMEDAQIEALVRTIKAPLLTGGKIHTSTWELFIRELESTKDIKHTCIKLNTIIKTHRDD